MPKQLPQITILRTGYPYSRKTIFHQQRQQKLGILAIDLLLPDSLGLDTQFRQGPLEPACIPGGLHPRTHAYSSQLQFSIELLCFSITVIQSPFVAFPSLCICKRDLLKARVIIYA